MTSTRSAAASGQWRIVHVTDTFAPRVGGIETLVADLAERQARAGAAVHVLTAAAAARGGGGSRFLRTEILPGGARLHRFASPWTFGVPVHPRAAAVLDRALGLLTRYVASTVVHVHAGVVSPVALAAVRVACRRGLPVVVTWHSRLDGWERPWALAARLTGVYGPGAGFVATSVSTAAADAVRRALGRQDVTLIPNAVDPEQWVAAPHPDRAARDRGGPLRLTATQRLAPRKRGRDLVEAVLRAHRLLGRGPDGQPRLTLTLVGDGPQRRSIERRVTRAKAQDVVRLTGRLPREHLAALYARHHVFVTLTSLEAFGIAALEAKTAGLVVVAPAASGARDFLRREDGDVLLEGRSAADRLGELVEVLRDLATRPHLLDVECESRNSKNHVYGWEKTVAACEQAYCRAIESAR